MATTSRIVLGSPNMSSRLLCSDRETKAAANAVTVGSTKRPLERMQRDRLPTQRREIVSDRVRSGRTSSAAATIVNNPKMASAGISPGSLPGSGSGIVGAATDGSARHDNPGITIKMRSRCLGMVQFVVSVRLGGSCRARIRPNRPDAGRPEQRRVARAAFRAARRARRMPDVEPSRRERLLEQEGPKIVRRVSRQDSEKSLSGEPSSRRKGTQSEGESDYPYLAQATRQLGVFAPKPEFWVEPSGGLESPLGDDAVAAEHHRSGSEDEPGQQVNNICPAIKSRRDEPRPSIEIVVSDRTTQADEVRATREFRQRRA